MFTIKVIKKTHMNSAHFFKRLYHSHIIDHYENPRNVGLLNMTSPYLSTGLVGAPA